jgi:multiple sugar transport system substrate-binding protein
MIRLKGINWQHRRAVDPIVGTLETFYERHPDIVIDWTARPLSGFEFAPIEQLARDYDLIILDHPFAGQIAATGCLSPLDNLLRGQEKAFIGPSLASYDYKGSIWALPVDAACQVAVSRPDLMRALGRETPKSFDQVMALGSRARARGWHLAIGLSEVHSLMTFFTYMANLGAACATEPEQDFCDVPAAREVLKALRALVKLVPSEAFTWNSISMHDQMVARDDLVYCPAVYGYATYAETDQRVPLRFHDLPGLASESSAGSTIGGTGLGISTACREPEAALAYSRYLLETETQRRFASLHGQPARVEAWDDAEIDARFGGCFSATRQTMEGCCTRPRYAGYLAFQEKAGPLVERHLLGDIPEVRLMDALRKLHETAGQAKV